MIAIESLPATSAELKALLRQRIALQEERETEADLPDLQCGMVSLLYARQALEKIALETEPTVFLQAYMQLLENRYSRIQAEDAGEYGSGRDALGEIIEYCKSYL